MMLEALFAQQQQEKVFLALLVLGLLLGLMLHLGTLLHRHPILRGLWDGLSAAVGSGMLLTVLMVFRSGLRAYAILGLLIGGLLYAAGFSGMVQGILRLLKKMCRKVRAKAGKAPPDDELSAVPKV